MLRISSIVLFFLISLNISAQSAFEFLKLDTSPRAAALAGSFVANNDDPNVIFYNPAGIYSLENKPASFSYVSHLLDINSASVSYSQEVEELGRFAAGIQYINYGDFTEADQFGNRTGEFGAGDLAVLVGYANQLDENFNYGANVKFIYSGIASQSSTGLAVDLGLQYLFPEDGWTIGFAALNLGSQLSSYFDKTETLPVDIRFGFTKQLAHMPFKFYGSFNRINEKQDKILERFSQFTFGGEFRFSKAIQFRFGYDNEKRKELKLDTSAGLAGFNLGLGILISDYKVDYAFSSMGLIGGLHRIGISTDL